MILMNDFAAEPEELIQQEILAVERVIRSGWYVLGAEVKKFEKTWSERCGIPFTVGVANGMEALEIGLLTLKFNPKEASGRLEKLLTSAISNYEAKTGQRPEDSNLVVKEIFVDSALQMKRLRTAPQGRANRIRKRSNHVTIVVDSKKVETKKQEETK